MTKSKKKTSAATNQLNLLDLLSEQAKQGPKTGVLDSLHDAEFRSAMTEDIKNAIDESGKELSRFDVVARMSNILEREITWSMLNNWTAPSHSGHNIDLDEMVAFVMATGKQRRAISVLFRPAGIFALPGPDALRAEMHRRDELIKQLKRENRENKLLLRRIEKGISL